VIFVFFVFFLKIIFNLRYIFHYFLNLFQLNLLLLLF